ncbi:hypothetical protein ACNPON_01440, partial [Glutamicibacter sp. AGC13]
APAVLFLALPHPAANQVGRPCATACCTPARHRRQDIPLRPSIRVKTAIGKAGKGSPSTIFRILPS